MIKKWSEELERELMAVFEPYYGQQVTAENVIRIAIRVFCVLRRHRPDLSSAQIEHAVAVAIESEVGPMPSREEALN